MDYKEQWSDFSGLAADRDVIEYLAQASSSQELSRKQYLVRQDEPTTHVYLVCSGHLEARYNTVDGQEIWLADLMQGAIVGELSALHAQSRTSSVVATKKSIVLGITQNNLIEAIKQDGEFGLVISQMLAERIAHTNYHLTARIGMNVISRLYYQLVRMASAGGEEIDGDLFLPARPQVNSLSTKIHTTRESTSRAMSTLEKQGLVERIGKGLRVRMPRSIDDLLD